VASAVNDVDDCSDWLSHMHDLGEMGVVEGASWEREIRGRE